jgi:hypothetical protein
MRHGRLCCEFPLPAVIDPGQILFGFRLLLVIVLLTDRRKRPARLASLASQRLSTTSAEPPKLKSRG